MRTLPLILALGGCSFSKDDLQTLLHDHTAVLANVEARLDFIETKLPETGGRRHGQGDGDYLYLGDMPPDGAWESGTMSIDGFGSSREGGSLIFSSLVLTYDDVVVDGTTYRGTADCTVSITIATGDVDVAYTLDGEIDADGELSGKTEMDWALQASSSDGGTPRYSGTINGRDVADLD